MCVAKSVLNNQYFFSVFPNATGLNFATWMIFNVPMMLFNILMAWLWLQVMYMGLLRYTKIMRDVHTKKRAGHQEHARGYATGAAHLRACCMLNSLKAL
jgi:hypothetical protein